jgi:hypothetical protein
MANGSSSWWPLVAADSLSTREQHMLRVDTSSLPEPRGAPRARRLLPNPPIPRRGQVTPRHELLPPADHASLPTTAAVVLRTGPVRAPIHERWSVMLELGDDDIAKLYGQGMARGAVVWKKGMLEWRPLLITPDLSGLLRRTRITLTESPAAAQAQVKLVVPPDEPTLPRNPLPALPRTPVQRELAADVVERSPIQSVAPSALDVEPSVKPGRRTGELLAVGVAAFALAWIGHARLHPAPTVTMMPAVPPAAAAATYEPSRAASTFAASALSGSAIPTVSIADLPLVSAQGARAFASYREAGSSAVRSTQTSNGRPSRSALVEALGQVARAASGCGERGGPVRVVVSFANSGVARSIQVSGADLPAQTRSCIIGAASRARVPAFTGDPVTVGKTL